MDKISEFAANKDLLLMTASRNYWQQEARGNRLVATWLLFSACACAIIAMSLGTYVCAADWPDRVANAEATSQVERESARHWRSTAEQCAEDSLRSTGCEGVFCFGDKGATLCCVCQ